MGLLDPVFPSTSGWSPTKPGSDQGSGPYAHGSVNRDGAGQARGVSLGAGLFHGQADEHGSAPVDLVDANLNLGSWRGSDGKTNFGVEADAQVLKMGMDPGACDGPFGYDLGILDAGAGIYANDSTFTIGAGGELLGGAGQYGTSDKNSQSDHFARGGLSAGPSCSPAPSRRASACSCRARTAGRGS
jgi:hypothetical protein